MHACMYTVLCKVSEAKCVLCKVSSCLVHILSILAERVRNRKSETEIENERESARARAETEREMEKETRKHHPMLQSSMARETGSDMFSFSFCRRVSARKRTRTASVCGICSRHGTA